MTYSTDARALDNAQDIIERFGGIRPMASKTGIPVTTIQGWKKRNVIPANRYEEVVNAAKESDIDLSDLLGAEEQKKENVQKIETETVFDDERPHSDLNVKPVQIETEEKQEPVKEEKQTIAQTVAKEKTKEKTIQTQGISGANKVALGAIIVLVVLLFSGLFWLGPGIKKAGEQHARIAELEKQLEEVREDQSSLSSIVPDNLRAQIGELKQQAAQVKEAVQTLSEEAAVLSEGVIGPDAGKLSERLARLEQQVGRFAELTGSEGLSAVMHKIDALQKTVQGQEQLTQSVFDLRGIVNAVQGDDALMGPALEEMKKDKSTALGQTLDGVSNEDLKAAAMLIGLSQFRHAMSRDNESFEEDLSVMRSFVGEDDDALLYAIDRLAPHAQNGILTPEGLSEEFRGFAGDIVVSSLKGEDVSVQERAVARLNDIFKVEKDGELVTGTETQMTVAAAQKLLDEGDVDGAMKMLAQLEGPAAETASPFMAQAETTVLAGQVQDMITNAVLEKVLKGRDLSDFNAAGFKGLIREFKDFVPKGELIEDPASGMKIYKRNTIPGF